MADNDNMNQDQNQDPFAHPIKRNNWWLYIFGGIVLVGIIIWFFIDWSYKNRHGEERAAEEAEQVMDAPAPVVDETLPAVTVDSQIAPTEAQEAAPQN